MGPKNWDPLLCLLPKVARHLCIKEKKIEQQNRKKPSKNGKPLVNALHHCITFPSRKVIFTYSLLSGLRPQLFLNFVLLQ